MRDVHEGHVGLTYQPGTRVRDVHEGHVGRTYQLTIMVEIVELGCGSIAFGGQSLR